MDEFKKNDEEQNIEENKEENKEKKDKEPEVKKVEITSEEDLAKFLEQIANKDKKQRVVVKGLHMNIVKNNFLNILVYFAINALLICGVLAAFRPLNFPNLWFVPVFIIVFTFVDYLLRFIIYRYFQRLLLLSIGTIGIVATILGIICGSLVIYFAFGVTANNTWLLIGSIATFIIIRLILVTLLRRQNPF